MSDWSTQPLPTGETPDLESALDQAHTHARMFGLWEVADDLSRIIGEMRARDAAHAIPPQMLSRGPVRRRT